MKIEKDRIESVIEGVAILLIIGIGILAIFFIATVAHGAVAGSDPCPSPSPGQPHVCLTWNAVTTYVNGTAIPNASTALSYNVYRSNVAGGENYGTPLNPSPLSTTSYYDSTVAVGTTYFYTTAAVLGGTLGAPSQEVSAQIPVPPSAPGSESGSID
jgi:hypothetical protein